LIEFSFILTGLLAYVNVFELRDIPGILTFLLVDVMFRRTAQRDVMKKLSNRGLGVTAQVLPSSWGAHAASGTGPFVTVLLGPGLGAVLA
jgi:hypothetical protein